MISKTLKLLKGCKILNYLGKRLTNKK